MLSSLLASAGTCLAALAAITPPAATPVQGASAPAHRSEIDLVLPDLRSVEFLGMTGYDLLLGGLVVCALGLVFGLVIYGQLRRMEVHRSMLEVSELIYETCKTY